MTSSRLSFYKDAKHLKSGRIVADDLIFDSTSNASQATDYRKKTSVFRLKLHGGHEYLFHAKDDTDMNEWITAINSTVTQMNSPTGVASSSSSTNSPKQQQQQLTMKTSSSGSCFFCSMKQFVL